MEQETKVTGGTYTLVGYRVEVRSEVGEPMKLLDNFISENWREFQLNNETARFMPIFDSGRSSKILDLHNLLEYEQAMFVAWAIRMHLGSLKMNYVSIRLRQYELSVNYSLTPNEKFVEVELPKHP